MHFAGSMEARKLSIVMASTGQALAHFPQPMHATEQAFLAIPPLSLLEQAIMTFLSSGHRLMMPLGQADTHFPHPVHFSGITTGRPFSPM
jgi:hypothetical protein